MKAEQMAYIKRYTDQPTQDFLLKLYSESGIEFSNTSQIHWIDLGIKEPLSKDKLLFYANPKYSADEMKVYYYAFCSGATVEQARLVQIYEPRSSAELDIVFDCILDGYGTDEINFYRDLFWKGDRSYHSRWLFNQCRKAVQGGLPMDWIYKLIQPGDDESKVKILDEVFRAGLTLEQAEKYKFAERKSKSIEYMTTALIGKFTKHRQDITGKYTEEQIALFSSTDLGSTQMREIILGIEHGLTEEQIKKFNNPKMTFKHMRLIREAIEEENPEIYINLISNPEMNLKQVGVLKQGYQNGVPIDKLFSIAKPHLNWHRMESMIQEEIFDKDMKSTMTDVEKNEDLETIFESIYQLIKTNANSFTGNQKKAIVNALLVEE